MKTFEQELATLLLSNNPLEVRKFIEKASKPRGFPRGLFANKAIDLNSLSINDDTFLMQAIYYDTPRTIAALIDAGADPFVLNSKGVNAVIAAAQLNNPIYMQELLNASDSKFAQDILTCLGDDNKTAFDIAIEHNNLETAHVIYLAGLIRNLAATGDYHDYIGQPIPSFAELVEISKTKIALNLENKDISVKECNAILHKLIENSGGKYTLSEIQQSGIFSIKNKATNIDVLKTIKNQSGNFEFRIKDPLNNPDILTALAATNPSQKWVITSCATMDQARLVIEKFGGADKVIFNDSDPHIAKIKEQLDNEYAVLFTSEKDTHGVNNGVKYRVI